MPILEDSKMREEPPRVSDDQPLRAYLTDTLTPTLRSERMKRVRDRDTGPELVVRRPLYAMGFRYRLQARELPGRPDIVFRRQRLALFVQRCFGIVIPIPTAALPDFQRAAWTFGFRS